jgi:hypothetical protein
MLPDGSTASGAEPCLNALDGFDPLDARVIYWDGPHDVWHAGPRSTPWPISTPA